MDSVGWQIGSLDTEKYPAYNVEEKKQHYEDGTFGAWSTNIHIIMFVTFFVSISVGCAFYTIFHGWEVSTAFYYSSQVLLGNMYNIPEELDSYSEAFTMVFFLWGTGLIACCHLIATNFATADMQENSSAKPLVAVGNDIHAPEFIVSFFRSLGLLRLLRSRGVFRIRMFCVFLAGIWIFLGAAYGILVEEWSYLHSFYFAIGAMSAAGVPNPPCENGDDQYPSATCSLGSMRGFALGFYLIVGVPLFAFTVGLLSGFVVDSVADANYRRIHSNEAFSKLLPSGTNLNSSSSPPIVTASTCGCIRGCCRRGASVRSLSEQPLTMSDFVLSELVRMGKLCNSDIAELQVKYCCCLPGTSQMSSNSITMARDLEASSSSIILQRDDDINLKRCSRSWWCRKRILSLVIFILTATVLLLHRRENLSQYFQGIGRPEMIVNHPHAPIRSDSGGVETFSGIDFTNAAPTEPINALNSSVEGMDAVSETGSKNR